MSTVKSLRQRGFQLRRVSFGLKVLSLLWVFPMLGLFLTGHTWMHFFAAVTGLVAFDTPALILAAAFDEMAERRFTQASAVKQQGLLGVVQPRG